MILDVNNIIFTVNPSIEFIHALDLVANKETMYKFFSDFYFTPSEDFKNTIENMRSKLSRYIQNELRFFFQWEPMKHTLGRIVEGHKNIKSVSSFIEFIEQIHENELISYISEQALYGISSDSSMSRNTDDEITNRIIEILDNLDDDTTIDKEKLREFAENPLEIKSRLVLLMKQFYEKAYKQYETRILSILEKAKSKYENLYKENYASFDNEYLRVLPRDGWENLIIHISYFTQIRIWNFDIKPQNRTKWISLGMYSENYPIKKFIEAKVHNLIKVLSDKKRFEIIQILSKKPHCVSELANALDLTSPTVCYHLNNMLSLDLVSMKRENAKTFYTLNKKVIRELLDSTSEILLNENS
ncbi:ArsR/SmtB family transcription factor [Lutispora thermophila]|uniref:DNA-binding transcriptional regulator, ArsR family n=1 Tax=Lutispora thermophila DSM 19022 TaxID=1122184 RepID=A0A1M6EXU1_9FIRM|nr:metalloregulator ArsR/SmtB family transcription factor [Lutispora thermophila]SHI90253.1 DNA-binding transcriptional regulator, ArsR family [Lutispora thermophila DSM 19022]